MKYVYAIIIFCLFVFCSCGGELNTHCLYQVRLVYPNAQQILNSSYEFIAINNEGDIIYLRATDCRGKN